MLAPPSEGTFDIEDRDLPLKNSPKDSTQEQVPLLTQEAMPTNSDAPKMRMVRTLLSICYIILYLFQLLQDHVLLKGDREK